MLLKVVPIQALQNVKFIKIVYFQKEALPPGS